MKKHRAKNQEPHLTKGSVFDDIGLTPGEACEAKIKSEIWRAVVDHIDVANYSQSELVRKLKVHQPEVSYLLNGKMSRFSVTKLISFATRLNLHVQMTITPAKDSTVLPSLNAGSRKRKNARELASV